MSDNKIEHSKEDNALIKATEEFLKPDIKEYEPLFKKSGKY